jgi:hypothetical protein
MKLKNIFTVLASMYLFLNNGSSCFCQRKSDWQALFNGKDLNGWTPKMQHSECGENYENTFRVKNKTIQVRYNQYTQGFGERYGHLYTDRAYSYYILKLKYKVTGKWLSDAPWYTEGNSGVMYHSQAPWTMNVEQDWPRSIEMQFLANKADGSKRTTGNMCSPGTHITYKGKLDERHCIDSNGASLPKDQWVEATLTVLGDSLITHSINGKEVFQYSKPTQGGPLVNNYEKLYYQEGALINKGHIALQSEGQEMDFKDIKILNLEGCMDKKAKNYKAYYLKNTPESCIYSTKTNEADNY